MQHRLACGVVLVSVLAGAALAEKLERGAVCFRFCEDGSQEAVNRRGDCPADAPCAPSTPKQHNTVSIDTCGQRASVCGGKEIAAAGRAPTKATRCALTAKLRDGANVDFLKKSVPASSGTTHLRALGMLIVQYNNNVLGCCQARRVLQGRDDVKYVEFEGPHSACEEPEPVSRIVI